MALLLLASLCAALIVPVSTQAQTNITLNDGVGRTVQVPQPLNRVVALHDGMVALPLIELGVSVVGSMQRMAPSGTRYMLGLEQLYGANATDLNIASVETADLLDAERILTLKPDLIVGTEHELDKAELLSGIAPTYFLTTSGAPGFGLEPMRRMALDFGLMDRFEMLEAEYHTRLSSIRSRSDLTGASRTYAALVLWDEIHLFTGWGGLGMVLDDLGYVLPDWVQGLVGEQLSLPISPEMLGELEVDLLIIMAPVGITDRQAAFDAFAKVAPGWHLLFSRDEIAVGDVRTMVHPTFASAHAALDVIERHDAQRSR